MSLLVKMSQNKVYINDYYSSSSLGIEKDRILNSLLNDNPVPVCEGTESIYHLPYYKIPYDYSEFGNISRVNAILFQIFDRLVAKLDHNDKKIPLFFSTSTGGIVSTEEVYADIVENDVEFPVFENHFFNNLTNSVLKRYSDYFEEAFTFSTACSSSGHSILQAWQLIKEGHLDRAIVVGIDVISQTTMVGFDSLRLVSHDESGSRPLSESRNGLTLGEGCGVLVLSKDDIGAVAEVCGCASNSDGYHISSPDPEGSAQKDCIENAIKQAKITHDDIDYINAHGTGTPMNDSVEMGVISRIFGMSKPVTSLKSFIGHTLGGSTTTEIAIILDMLSKGVIVQHKGFSDPIQGVNIPLSTIERHVNYFIKSSFGFGGNNVSIVLKYIN